MIHASDNYYLLKGFQQLNTRYSTGLPNQLFGGLLIYCFFPRLDTMMEAWEKYLGDEIQNISFSPCKKNALARNSQHPHDRTGQPFTVRHMPVSLYFEPKDTLKTMRRKTSKKVRQKSAKP